MVEPVHDRAEALQGAVPAQAVAGSVVDLVGNGIELLLTVLRQVRPLGEVLADQPVFSEAARCQGLCGSQN